MKNLVENSGFHREKVMLAAFLRRAVPTSLAGFNLLGNRLRRWLACKR
jgi:hypothetical protein